MEKYGRRAVCLLSAIHSLLGASYETKCGGGGGMVGLLGPDGLMSRKLSDKLARQLEEPLCVASRSFWPWCTVSPAPPPLVRGEPSLPLLPQPTQVPR